jgi:hypothetical protein
MAVGLYSSQGGGGSDICSDTRLLMVVESLHLPLTVPLEVRAIPIAAGGLPHSDNMFGDSATHGRGEGPASGSRACMMASRR